MEWMLLKMKERKTNMGDDVAEDNKREEFGRGTMEKQVRIVIKDQPMAQDVLTRNYIYIFICY